MKYKSEERLLSHYNSNVKYYSPVNQGILKQIFILKKLGLKKTSEVLDLGCGTGLAANYIQKKYRCNVTGIDCSEKRIVAAAKNSKCRFIVDDVNLAICYLDKKTYDLITAFETLEHLENPVAVLEQCKRILKPDGVLIGSVPLKHEYVAHLQYFNSLKDVEKKLGVKVFARFQLSYEYAFFTL